MQGMHGTRPDAQTKALHATGNGAGRDKQYFFVVLAQQGNLPRPFVDSGQIKPPAIVGDERGAHFDDESF